MALIRHETEFRRQVLFQTEIGSEGKNVSSEPIVMSDNVILLGAGASADAGIPMMNTFMEVMWQIARIGRWKGQAVKAEDREILIEALKVREELDGYHGRAAVDVWNIEDILSILSFNALAGGRKETNRLKWMTKAIARVIEITDTVVHDGVLSRPLNVGLYSNFWRFLIDWTLKHGTTLPPILTFNYDLVLERALLHGLVGKYYRTPERGFPYETVQICYSTDSFQPEPFVAKNSSWPPANRSYGREPGMILEEMPDNYLVAAEKHLKIELLKLHGSVNFPRSNRTEPIQLPPTQRLINPLDDPLILPPVFNKATDSIGKDVWSRAMHLLRNCKNLIICGYSLPATDIYMQYFLKAALGPNQDLNRIFVFDPVLFDPSREVDGASLRNRYACNFSESFQKRIDFKPFIEVKRREASGLGTTKHLVHLLQYDPGQILFGG